MYCISKTYGLALTAVLAAAFAAGNAFAQEQSNQQRDQEQRTQSDQQQSDQPSSDEQAQQNQQQQQERQRQEQERQRQPQSQQRDQQSQDRDQSSWRDSDSSRDRDWPQPDGREYGSDSLRYRGEQSFSRDGQRSRSRQGGLGVSLRSDGRAGVIVSQVHSGSPAQEMGIRRGDRITQVNGREIQSVQQFIARIRNMEPGEQIELDIRRARGGEQTVRGELESRDEALADRRQQRGSDNQPGERWSSDEFGRPQSDNWQTSYDEERGSSSQNRSGQYSTGRLEQIERQVDRLSRELDVLRISLQSIRRQSGQSSEWNRERTARYDEFEGATGRRQSDERRDGRDNDRPAEREREFEREGPRFDRDSDRDEPRDRFDEGPGGEIGSDRQSVGSENLQDRD